MNFLSSWYANPDWLDQHAFPFSSLDQVPPERVDAINRRLDQVISPQPVVTILVIAYNEEINLLRCVSTLANLQTRIPFEILAVNNNSTDRTQETMNRLHIRNFLQPIQGCGPARQLGQEMAAGPYIMLADADCFYPSNWLDQMMQVLTQPDTVCVYGRYSFIASASMPRWQLAIYEALKAVVTRLRHYKRPYLNAYGISMGYVRAAGLRAGYTMQPVRGEDGRLCFDMMPYGRVRSMNVSSARAWTGTRTLSQDGPLWRALTKRIGKELGQVFYYLTPLAAHDTKSSLDG